MGFNSTLVQLKVGCKREGKTKEGGFQFYLSSIKSFLDKRTSCIIIRFQFYLSSIKRQTKITSLYLLQSFNSTLVQLKEL